MSDVWFTADSHFDHQRVAELRGFASTEDHDAAIVERWNAVVRPGDIVWHLGDVGMGRLRRFESSVRKLNGELHLITGNHDECWPGIRNAHTRQREWLDMFATVQQFARRKVNGWNVMLSHLPYRDGGDHTVEERHTQYRLPDEGLPLLCGHVHEAWKVAGRQINVGLDVHDHRPVHLDVVAELVGQVEP